MNNYIYRRVVTDGDLISFRTGLPMLAVRSGSNNVYNILAVFEPKLQVTFARQRWLLVPSGGNFATKIWFHFNINEIQKDNRPSDHNAFLDYLLNSRMRGIFLGLFNDVIFIEEIVALNERESMSYES